MTLFEEFAALWQQTLVWGFVATVVMTTILNSSQGLGFSRLSLSFLAGTFFTGNRGRANVLGYLFYFTGGWLFAFLYVLVLVSVPLPGIVTGTLTGFGHGVFLLTVVLTVLPYVHPRMATTYDGPTRQRRLEPPGFLGLNYGRRTPLVTLTAQTLYGAIMGGLYQLGA